MHVSPSLHVTENNSCPLENIHLSKESFSSPYIDNRVFLYPTGFNVLENQIFSLNKHIKITFFDIAAKLNRLSNFTELRIFRKTVNERTTLLAPDQIFP